MTEYFERLRPGSPMTPRNKIKSWFSDLENPCQGRDCGWFIRHAVAENKTIVYHTPNKIYNENTEHIKIFNHQTLDDFFDQELKEEILAWILSVHAYLDTGTLAS